MRIALFSWETIHSIPVGGISVHVTELAAGLERLGHEVHVFTRQGHNQPTYDRIHGVHYHRCVFELNSSFVGEINNMCRAFVDCFYAVETGCGKFDIVHAHDWLASNAVVWIKEGCGHKAIVTIHSTEYGRNGNAFHGGDAPRVQGHERHATYCADRVITVSHRMKEELNWLYEVPREKIQMIYNGVNSSVFDYDVDPGEVKGRCAIGPVDPMILFVGRMVVQKGPDILVRSVPVLMQRWPNLRIAFAGSGNQYGRLEHRAGEIGLAYAVRLLGDVERGHLTRLLRSSEALVLPSRYPSFSRA